MKAVPSRTTWIWSRMKRLTIVLFLLLSAVLAFAQEPLSGIVVDDAGKALAGANVMAYGPDGKVLSFAVTGADGTFQLKKTAGLERITGSRLSAFLQGSSRTASRSGWRPEASS